MQASLAINRSDAPRAITLGPALGSIDTAYMCDEMLQGVEVERLGLTSLLVLMVRMVALVHRTSCHADVEIHGNRIARADRVLDIMLLSRVGCRQFLRSWACHVYDAGY